VGEGFGERARDINCILLLKFKMELLLPLSQWERGLGRGLEK